MKKNIAAITGNSDIYKALQKFFFYNNIVIIPNLLFENMPICFSALYPQQRFVGQIGMIFKTLLLLYQRKTTMLHTIGNKQIWNI